MGLAAAGPVLQVELTPNLRASQVPPNDGQTSLRDTRVRMRGTKDSPSPLNHVLHDGLGPEQVVACVEMKSGHVNAVAQHGSVLVRRRPSPVSGWSMRTQARLLLMPSVRSSSDPSDR